MIDSLIASNMFSHLYNVTVVNKLLKGYLYVQFETRVKLFQLLLETDIAK